MVTFILAGTAQEGREYARLGGLRPGEAVVVGSAAGVLGVKVADDDLVVEFPSFAHKRDREEILENLKVAMKRGGVPRWERIGAS